MPRSRKYDGVVYRKKETPSGGFAIAIEAVCVAGNPLSQRTGKKLNGYLGNGFRPEIATF